MREEARDFRLISTALSAESRVRTRDEEEEKLSQGSIETIHQQLFHTLDLLRRSLELQTCGLLWLDERGRAAEVQGAGHRLADIAEGPLAGRRAARCGAMLKERSRSCSNRRGSPLLPYYAGPGRGGGLRRRAGGRGAHRARRPVRRPRATAQAFDERRGRAAGQRRPRR